MGKWSILMSWQDSNNNNNNNNNNNQQQQQQQQQTNSNGNVVSFTTTSKDLLSNLAITKLTSNVRTSEPSAEISPKQPKTISVTVYGAQAKHPGNNNKVNNEKFLLPKSTTSQSLRYPTNCHVEVKKFAPEMNGLLTGLSTGIRGVTNGNITNKSDKNYKTFAKNHQTLSPAAITLINDAAKGLKGGPMILPAANYNKKPSMIKRNTSVTTIVHNPNSVHRTMSKPLSLYNNTKINKQPPDVNRINIITSYNKNKNKNNNSSSSSNSNNSSSNNNNTSVLNPKRKITKPSRGTATHASAIVENRRYKSNKVLLENNTKKTTNFKIKSILLQDFLKQEEFDKQRTDKGKTKLNE